MKTNSGAAGSITFGLKAPARGVAGLFAALLVVGLAGPTRAANRKVYPVDGGPGNRSFATFRRRLIAAARRHDRRFIYRIVAPDIQFTFGEGRGRRDFIHEWSSRPQGALERELLGVLTLGGQWGRRNEFCAPYTDSRLCDVSVDLQEGVILGKAIRVRARPDTTAPVVDVLSYDRVKMDYSRSVPPNTDHPAWARVTTPISKGGYVPGRAIRSVVDYRARFVKRRGRWVMMTFIAGD
jgi:hypothetical protein